MKVTIFAIAMLCIACGRAGISAEFDSPSRYQTDSDLENAIWRAFDRHDFSHVLKICDDYIMTHPHDVSGYFARGRVHSILHDIDKTTNHYAKAMADFEETLRLDPTFAPAYVKRGHLQSKNGLPSQAVLECARAIRIDSKYDLAYLERAIGLEKLGEDQAALRDLDRFFALEMEKPRSDYRAYALHGVILMRHGYIRDAVNAFGKAIAVRPEPSIYGGRAHCWLVLNEYERAFDDFSKQIELGDIKGRAGRAEVCLLQKRYTECLTDSEELLRANPNDFHGNLYRAQSLLDLNRSDEAAAFAEKATRISPSSVEAILTKAEALTLSGNVEEAIGVVLSLFTPGTTSYETVIEPKNGLKRDSLPIELVAPHFIATVNARANDMNAMLAKGIAMAVASDDVEAAIASIDSVLLSTPRDPRAHIARAVAAFRREHFAQCLADCSEAVRIDPRYTLAYGIRSTAAYKMGDHLSAVADLIVKWNLLRPAQRPNFNRPDVCLVESLEKSESVMANPQITSVYQGHTYAFSSHAAREKFEANQDSYLPYLNGYDPVLLVEGRSPSVYANSYGTFGNRAWAFQSRITGTKFFDNPEYYFNLISNAMKIAERELALIREHERSRR